VSAAISLCTFENLLYTNRDAGFQAYEEGHPLPHGRVAVPDDPLKRRRRFVMELQSHWQEVHVPGSILVADETMAGSEPQIVTSPFSSTSQQAKVYAEDSGRWAHSSDDSALVCEVQRAGIEALLSGGQGCHRHATTHRALARQSSSHRHCGFLVWQHAHSVGKSRGLSCRRGFNASSTRRTRTTSAGRSFSPAPRGASAGTTPAMTGSTVSCRCKPKGRAQHLLVLSTWTSGP
jgi:hypothetical protein